MDKAHENWSEKLIQQSLTISPVNEAVTVAMRTHLNGTFQQSALPPTEIKKIAHSLLKMISLPSLD